MTSSTFDRIFIKCERYNKRLLYIPSEILCGSGCCVGGLVWKPGGGFCVCVGQPESKISNQSRM